MALKAHIRSHILAHIRSHASANIRIHIKDHICTRIKVYIRSHVLARIRSHMKILPHLNSIFLYGFLIMKSKKKYKKHPHYFQMSCV